jgi:hypothetical protein
MNQKMRDRRKEFLKGKAVLIEECSVILDEERYERIRKNYEKLRERYAPLAGSNVEREK